MITPTMALARESEPKTIPVFLSIDVEPDGFQLSRSDPPRWVGYDAAFELIESLRAKLTGRIGETPKFGWYFRTDPQIAEIYGRPDYVMTEKPDRAQRLREEGDYFGVHSHPIRWHEEQRKWVHDFQDTRWNVDRTRFSLDAFARWNGTPARHFRGGAGFINNEIVDTLDQAGIKVDLTLEPATTWRAIWYRRLGRRSDHQQAILSGVDRSPSVGILTDCLSAPRVAYRPSHNDFRIPDKRNGRDLLMVPLATYVPTGRKPFLRQLSQLVLLKRHQREVRVLHLSNEWPSSSFYWDLAIQHFLSMPRPYLSLALRTDSPESLPAIRARKLFDALLENPLVERLRFVDPLDVAANLVSDN